MELKHCRELARLIQGTWTISIFTELGVERRRFSDLRTALQHPDSGAAISRQQLTDALGRLRERGIVERDPDGLYGLTRDGRRLIAHLQRLEALYAELLANAAAAEQPTDGATAATTRPGVLKRCSVGFTYAFADAGEL